MLSSMVARLKGVVPLREMMLCDVSCLDRFSHTDAADFVAKLVGVGVRREVLHPISRLCERLPDPLRNPIRRWHLRRLLPPLSTVLRAFFFADPVEGADIEEAIGSERLQRALIESALMVQQGSCWVSPFRLNLINELFVFTDDLCQGGDAVMGAGATTAGIIQAAWPSHPVDSLLDMGCGAGTVALLMAGMARQVVGIDISHRAMTIARLNARLAAVQNTVFQTSNLFSEIQSRKFDLIVSQPPFVSAPADAEAITFLHGGARGDELSMRLISEIPEHLAPGGRAVLLVDWPTYDALSPTERIRSAIGNAPVDLLVLLATPKDLDEHVTYYGSMMFPTLGPEFERYVLVHREHLEKMGIRELRLALIVLRRTELKPWTRLLEIRPMMEVEPTGAQVDRLIAVQDILAQGDDVLLTTSLGIPEATRFVEVDANHMRIELPDSRLLPHVTTSRAGADLLLEVDRAKTVAEGVEAMFQRVPQLRKSGVDHVLIGVRGALDSGLLEVVTDTTP